MPRYKITIEYDGGPFVGWQRQDNGPSVQAEIEDAIVEFCAERVTLQAAGRTDSGVHALGQVAHFDLEAAQLPKKICGALNHHLKPNPIAILAAEEVPETFEARFSATARHYRYVIENRQAPLALDRGRAWQVAQPLDVEAMHEAAQFLAGRHDFTTFRASQCQAKSPVRTLDRVAVRRAGPTIEVTASALSFLHHQVRSIVGSLKMVGLGKWPPQKIQKILKAKDRTACGALAPADGLYLVCVDYDQNSCRQKSTSADLNEDIDDEVQGDNAEAGDRR